jgi:glycosyltransferase involved in cell wall biosynthesis
MEKIDMPRVSVGLPVYNGERFLNDLLDSLLDQTYKDFELVICDNASDDRTPEICDSYVSDNRHFRFYRNEKNLGAAHNFNRAFQLSSGEYFKWVACDDVYAPTHLEKCLEILDREPSVVLSYPKTVIIDEKGKKVCDYEDRLNLRSSMPHKRLRQFLRKPPGCNPIYGLMRAEVLGETQLIGAYESADYNLLAEMCLRGEFCEVPEPLFYRRSHPGMSRRAHKTSLDFTIWKDPSHAYNKAFPYLKVLFGLIKSINRVPLNRCLKYLCLIEVLGSSLTLGSRTCQWLRARSDPARLF